MPDIIISEFMDEDAVAWLSERAGVHYDPNLVEDEAKLFNAIADVPALIVRSSATIDQRLLDAGPKLKVIGRLGVGLERFDLDACAARNVEVVKSTGANALSVAEYVMAMCFTLLRPGTYHSSDVVASGAWPRIELVGREAAGKTLGIVGLGSIGTTVAKHAAVLGINVVAYDPYVPQTDNAWQCAARKATLSDLLAVSDIISMHTPLTDETRHMINVATLAQAKPGAMIINSARGAVIDADALIDALANGQIGGAAIDVYAEEPLAKEAGSRFKGLSNVILTPHVAGVTDESNKRVSQMTAELVLQVLKTAAVTT